MSVEDMLTDLYAHDLHNNPPKGEEFEDEDFDENDVARQIGYVPKDGQLPDDFEDVT